MLSTLKFLLSSSSARRSFEVFKYAKIKNTIDANPPIAAPNTPPAAPCYGPKLTIK